MDLVAARRLDTLTAVTHLTFGRADPDLEAGTYPTVFAVGRLHGEQGFYRSTGEGISWVRINDWGHQFGQIPVIAGDRRQFGRLFVGTGGSGVVRCELRSTRSAKRGGLRFPDWFAAPRSL